VTVLAFLLVSVLIARTTRWGGQFWRLAGPYLRPVRADRRSRRPALLVLVALLLVVISVRINVLVSYVINGLYTALQDFDTGGFARNLGIFAVISVLAIAQTLAAYYIGQVIVIGLWESLNDRLLGDWLSDRTYHRSGFLPETVDNPDQRIQQDVNTFAANSVALSIGSGGAVDAVVTIPAFTVVLWELSGPLSLFGLEIPRAMTFLVFLYVIVATVIAFRIGRPLIGLNFRNEGLQAFFRFGLVRVRENSESIAFYRGEPIERRELDGRFSAVIANFWRIVGRTVKFQGFNVTVTQFSQVFPLIIQAPRYFARAISLGDVQQTATAFGQVHDALSFFRNAYDDFARYRAVLDRLTGLLDNDIAARALPVLPVAERADGVVVRDLTVRRPDGVPLLEDVSLDLAPGERLLVTGRSGSGKTTLLRTLAELWPYAEGDVARPTGRRSMFLAQQPYVPLGSLRTALSYPELPEAFDGARMREVLGAVSLRHLEPDLDEEGSWFRTLSPGEQQRLALGRLLLARPDVAFLDEATAALDEGLEYELYTQLRSELPELILLSVGHRSSLEAYHDSRLEIADEGRWTLAPIDS
jgi:putative ATP-binding cassette transporter